MPYLVCCCHIFTSLKNTWKDILLLNKLLFTIPIANADLERMFSMLNKLKHYIILLTHNWLERLVQISEDGPDFKTYDVLPVVKKWLNQKDRCIHQTCCKTYEKRKGIKRKLSSLNMVLSKHFCWLLFFMKDWNLWPQAIIQCASAHIACERLAWWLCLPTTAH